LLYWRVQVVDVPEPEPEPELELYDDVYEPLRSGM
jgi:hypothetical protein